MSVTIDLDPKVEADYAARAAREGVSLAEYLRHVLEGHGSAGRRLSPSQRAARWRAAALGLPETKPLSDDAISRESIYGTR